MQTENKFNLRDALDELKWTKEELDTLFEQHFKNPTMQLLKDVVRITMEENIKKIEILADVLVMVFQSREESRFQFLLKLSVESELAYKILQSKNGKLRL